MAYGRFGGGDGSVANPYLIEDASDLDAIRNSTGSNYKLLYSINLGISPYNTGKGWDPIPNFTGTLNGNGKKIFNLYINRGDEDYIGLFANITNAATTNAQKVWDLGIENANITGRYRVGILAGRLLRQDNLGNFGNYNNFTNLDNSARIVERCYVCGKVTGNAYVGGLTGEIYINPQGTSYDSGPNGYAWYADNESWEALRDCFVNVDLFGTTVGDNYFGLLTGIYTFAPNGYITSSSSYTRDIIRMANTICVGTYTCLAGAGVANAYGKIGSDTARYSLSFSNCLYDSTLWATNGNISGALPHTTEQLQNIDPNVVSIESSRLANNDNIWYARYGSYPRLWFTFQNYYFVFAENKYLTYDKVNKVWVKQTDSMPTREQAIALGMLDTDISQLDAYAMNQLKTYGIVDLICILEKSEQVTSLEATVGFNKDVTHSNDTNVIRTAGINFSTYNNDITCLAM